MHDNDIIICDAEGRELKKCTSCDFCSSMHGKLCCTHSKITRRAFVRNIEDKYWAADCKYYYDSSNGMRD